MIEASKIHLFEEHSSTLPVWWENHSSPRTVVYLDAHLDLQPTTSNSLEALKACTRLEEVRKLEARNHLDPSPRFAYGIENFLYPAHRLGLIGRLVWVAPAHIPRHYSSSLLDYMQQMDGISFDELTGFRKIGNNTMRGSLMGLDITICNYDELETADIDDDYYLDIDIDYFVEVPSDRLWIDPAVVIDRVRAQLGDPSLVTISRAVSSGFTPLAYRFVGDYLYSLLKEQTKKFDYYHGLYCAILELRSGNLDAGRERCAALIEDQPGPAAAYHILALCSADSSEKKRLLATAGQRDEAYRFDPAREAIGLLHRKKRYNPDELKMLLTSLDSLALEPERRRQAEIAFAQVLATSGRSEQAMSLLKTQTGDYAEHPEVLLAICMSRLGNAALHEETRRMLEHVSRNQKNATMANLYLGDLEFAEQNFRAALDYYVTANNRAQAWMLPLERMLGCYQKLGMDAEAEHTRRELARRRQRLNQLVG